MRWPKSKRGSLQLKKCVCLVKSLSGRVSWMVSAMAPSKRYLKEAEKMLDLAVAKQHAISVAEFERDAAFSAAWDAGWTRREIADRVGISATTVHRIIGSYRKATSR